MLGKKAYIRTMEAVLAIIILLIFVYTVIPRQPIEESGTEDVNIKLIQDHVFFELANNDELRSDIISKNNESLNDLVTNVINQRYNYEIAINDLGGSLILPNNISSDKAIYVRSAVISTNKTEYDPKIVTLYLWLK